MSGPGPLSGHSLAPVVRAHWALLVYAGYAAGLLLARAEQYVFRLPSLKAWCHQHHRIPKGLSSTFSHVSVKHTCGFSTAFIQRDEVLLTTDPPESLTGP